MKYKYIVLIALSLIAARVKVYSRQDTEGNNTIKNDTLQYESKGILVTGDKNQNPILISQPKRVMQQKELLRYSPSSISEQFAKLPGVSNISSGEGITRPVIRGLGGSRIKTVIDGLALETQVWDDEHGIGVNERDFTEAIAVLGPSVLLYGTDAIGGALIFNDYLEHGMATQADATAGFLSNGLGFFGGIDFKGDAGESSYWKVSAFTKSISDYRYANNLRAFNTRFWRSGLNAVYGYDEDWGSLKLRYKLNHGLYGILDPFELENPDFEEGEEYPHEFEAPYHLVLTNRFQLNSDVMIGGRVLKLAAAYDLDIRDEFEPKNGNPKLPEKFIGLQTNAIHFKGSYPVLVSEGFETKVGLRSDYSTMDNNADYSFVPNNNILQIGGFLLSEFKMSDWVFSGGVSYDNTVVSTSDYLGLFGNGFERDFGAASGNLGLSWLTDEASNLSLNLSSGFRPPNINELASNGYKPESMRIEYGDKNLDYERVNGADLSYVHKEGDMNLNATVYVQDFGNFIFLEEFEVEFPVDMRPKFKFKQQDVMFYGFELSWGIVENWVNSQSSFDIVFSTTKNDLESDKFIIYNLPADKLGFNLSHRFADFSGLNAPTISLQWMQYMNIWDDGRLDVNSNGKWYHVLNLNLESEIVFENSKMTLGLSGKNILNKEYVSPLSRLSIYNIPNPGISVNAYVRYPFDI